MTNKNIGEEPNVATPWEPYEEEVVEVETATPVENTKPTLGKGNYLVEIISEGQVIKKIAVANSEINITKLVNGGLAIDLK